MLWCVPFHFSCATSVLQTDCVRAISYLGWVSAIVSVVSSCVGTSLFWYQPSFSQFAPCAAFLSAIHRVYASCMWHGSLPSFGSICWFFQKLRCCETSSFPLHSSSLSDWLCAQNMHADVVLCSPVCWQTFALMRAVLFPTCAYTLTNALCALNVHLALVFAVLYLFADWLFALQVHCCAGLCKPVKVLLLSCSCVRGCVSCCCVVWWRCCRDQCLLLVPFVVSLHFVRLHVHKTAREKGNLGLLTSKIWSLKPADIKDMILPLLLALVAKEQRHRACLSSPKFMIRCHPLTAGWYRGSKSTDTDSCLLLKRGLLLSGNHSHGILRG